MMTIKRYVQVLHDNTPTIQNGECSRCGECCRWVIMPFAPGGRDFDEWYFVRGIKIDPLVGLLIPSTCQHLKQVSGGGNIWKCDIYDTRPVLCRLDNMQGKTIRGYKHRGCTAL